MAGGSDAVARFSLELDGNAGQFAGDQARALANLQEKIQGDTTALREMQKALRNLQGGSAVNIQVARDLKDRIAAQKATIASTTQSYVQMGGTFKDIAKGGKDTGAGLKELTQTIQSAPGPLGRLTSGFSGLNSLIGGGLMAGAIVAVAAAIATVTAAAAVGAAALLRYGVGVADARRNELLHLEALGKLRYGYLGLAGGFAPAADKASFLQSTIDGVSASVALSRDQVAGYAEDLYRTGLRGGNLQAALEGVAITAATQGEAAAGSFKSMALGAGLAGGSVRKLADDVKARLGGIAAAQLLSLDVQTRKLHESFAMLFSGLKIDTLLAGVSKITELFSQSSSSGRALKVLIEGLFNPLIEQVSGPASLLVKRFFQGMVIAALGLGIVVLKLRNWFRATFGDTSLLKGMDLQRLAVMAGTAAIFTLAGAVVLAGIVLANLAALVLLPIAAIVGLGIALYAGVKALGRLGASAYEAAGGIISGLVSGIKGGAAWVIQAIENLGTSAMKAFREKLGIHSPSRIAMRAAIEVPRGVAVGIKAGQPEVEAATRAMVSLPTSMADGDEAGSSGGKSLGGSSRTVSINELHVHATSVDQAKEAARAFIEEINQQFGAVATALGAAVP